MATSVQVCRYWNENACQFDRCVGEKLLKRKRSMSESKKESEMFTNLLETSAAPLAQHRHRLKDVWETEFPVPRNYYMHAKLSSIPTILQFHPRQDMWGPACHTIQTGEHRNEASLEQSRSIIHCPKVRPSWQLVAILGRLKLRIGKQTCRPACSNSQVCEG